MRRLDRQITDQNELLEIVDRCEVCRIGFAVEGQAYITPLNFGYENVGDSLTLYFHGAAQGRKLDMMASNPLVCFEMDCGHRLITSDVGCGFTYDYESVIGEGILEEVTDLNEKIHALDVVLAHYSPNKTYDYQPQAARSVCVLKLTIQSMTGKRNKS